MFCYLFFFKGLLDKKKEEVKSTLLRQLNHVNGFIKKKKKKKFMSKGLKLI